MLLMILLVVVLCFNVVMCVFRFVFDVLFSVVLGLFVVSLISGVGGNGVLFFVVFLMCVRIVDMNMLIGLLFMLG